MSVSPVPSGPVSPVNVPAADREAHWLANTYRPHEANLTVRAVVVGMLIGAWLWSSTT